MDLAQTARTRPYGRAAILAGIAGFTVLTILMWHSTRPETWERPIISAVDGVPLVFRDFWISLFQPLPFALTTIALGGAAAARGRYRLALAGVAGSLGAVLAAQLVFKPLVDRVRTHRVAGVNQHLHVAGRMFPSAHVTAAAAAATFAWLILDRRVRLAPLLVALPLLVGCAVISKQLHYPADVVAGLLLGATSVYCTVAVAHAVSGGAAVANSPAIERPRGGYPAPQRESE
ncbi:MAG: superfamily [Actinomycetota bacterium]|nr:superfamily [Actinomycetota bacterium]